MYYKIVLLNITVIKFNQLCVQSEESKDVMSSQNRQIIINSQRIQLRNVVFVGQN